MDAQRAYDTEKPVAWGFENGPLLALTVPVRWC